MLGRDNMHAAWERPLTAMQKHLKSLREFSVLGSSSTSSALRALIIIVLTNDVVRLRLKTLSVRTVQKHNVETERSEVS